MKRFSVVAAIALLLFPAAACLPPLAFPATDPADRAVEDEMTDPADRTVEDEETDPADRAVEARTYIRVLAGGLNIRSGAGTGYAVLGCAESGTLLGLSAQEGGWWETRYRGRKAYVSADARYTQTVELAAGDTAIERVIARGIDVLGTPYVYGATRLHDGKGGLLKGFSSDAFDCSSLMQYMLYGEGIMLGMTTRAQVVQGYHVRKEELKRGDLLFFTNAARKNKTGLERVGHVAMYLGDNYILHTASDYAKIEQISQTRWGYFLEARRFFPITQ